MHSWYACPDLKMCARIIFWLRACSFNLKLILRIFLEFFKIFSLFFLHFLFFLTFFFSSFLFFSFSFFLPPSFFFLHYTLVCRPPLALVKCCRRSPQLHCWPSLLPASTIAPYQCSRPLLATMATLSLQ